MAKEKRSTWKKFHEKNKAVSSDADCSWVTKIHPGLEAWRLIIISYMQRNEVHCWSYTIINKLQSFMSYLVYFRLEELSPEAFFRLDKVPNYPKYRLSVVTRKSYVAVANYNSAIWAFLEWVLSKYFTIQTSSGRIERNPEFRNPFHKINTKGEKHFKRKVSTTWKTHDKEFRWLDENPKLLPWKEAAVSLLKDRNKSVTPLLRTIYKFLDWIDKKFDDPSPEVLLKKTSASFNILPEFIETGAITSRRTAAREMPRFIDRVLRSSCSLPGDDGEPVIVPGYGNPFHGIKVEPRSPSNESVYAALPYEFIDEMRKILVEGPNFSDWKWARSVMGVRKGEVGRKDTAWFEVSENLIDRSDPDCVWRIRQRTMAPAVVELWSPVRFVALLVKLLLPLRNHQVVMLDSGESDTENYREGKWIKNTGPLVQGTRGKPWRQGVFQAMTTPLAARWIRHEEFNSTGETLPKEAPTPQNVQLYINTNKTADIRKSGSEKGYLMPWPVLEDPIRMDVYYWLDKLRCWQEKYNPIMRPVRWEEIPQDRIEAKSDESLASYPPACFLFRTAEDRVSAERAMPFPKAYLQVPFWHLLNALESRLQERGLTNPDGSKIKLVHPRYRPGATAPKYQAYYTLHGLRVSLVTALALDGKVPYDVLRRAVGHSRILMTLYYVKMGQVYLRERLAEGMRNLGLEENRQANLSRILAESSYDQVLQELVFNQEGGVKTALAESPTDRNPASFVDVGYGMCLVSANTGELDGKVTGGCLNGGPKIVGTPNNAPTPGGLKNCVACRWFVTGPQYILPLQRKFNNIQYHANEARLVATQSEAAFERLLAEKYDADEAKVPFLKQQEFREAENLRTTHMARWSDLEENLAACWNLMARCLLKLNASLPENGLVAGGGASELQAVFTSTESELLELSGVCEDLEIDPTLDPGKAIVRRSQLMDLALVNDGYQPLFLRLSEADQLKFANLAMRMLVKAANPSDSEVGKRLVVNAIEAGQKLSERFGVNLGQVLAQSLPSNGIKPLTTSRSRNVIRDKRSS